MKTEVYIVLTQEEKYGFENSRIVKESEKYKRTSLHLALHKVKGNRFQEERQISTNDVNRKLSLLCNTKNNQAALFAGFF